MRNKEKIDYFFKPFLIIYGLTSSVVQIPPPPLLGDITLSTHSHPSTPYDLISPLSETSSLSHSSFHQASASIVSNVSDRENEDPNNEDSGTRIDSRLEQSLSSDGTNTRQTAEQAYAQRQVDRKYKIKREAAYHLATVAVSLHKKFEKVLFKSAFEAVSNVNQMLGGDDFVTVGEISSAVMKGRINQPPPSQGRPGRLPDGVFEALSDLFFSHAALS